MRILHSLLGLIRLQPKRYCRKCGRKVKTTIRVCQKCKDRFMMAKPEMKKRLVERFEKNPRRCPICREPIKYVYQQAKGHYCRYCKIFTSY